LFISFGNHDLEFSVNPCLQRLSINAYLTTSEVCIKDRSILNCSFYRLKKATKRTRDEWKHSYEDYIPGAKLWTLGRSDEIILGFWFFERYSEVRKTKFVPQINQSCEDEHSPA
jgi:hypothetical protein